MNIPTVTTSRLTLRPFTEQDARPLHQILSVEGVLRYFPNPTPPPLERVQQLIANQLAHWEEHSLGWWAVERRAQSGLMGWCGLQFLPDTNETEVGYLLGKPFWGHGYATEAAQASVQFGFETLGLETIVGIVHPANQPSQRVIEKLGMVRTARTQYFGMDCYRYALERASLATRMTRMGQVK